MMRVGMFEFEAESGEERVARLLGTGPGSGAADEGVSAAEAVAREALEHAGPAVEWLVAQGIDGQAAERAAKNGMLGFLDRRSAKTPEGVSGHGGPALAFVARTLNPGHVQAVDLAYLDPALNGGVAAAVHGVSAGAGWCADIKRLRGARSVYVVLDPVEALAVESAGLAYTSAWAVRDLGLIGALPLEWLRGKQVAICLPNDAPAPEGHPEAGFRPGLRAAWALHERLTALDVSALLVDQAEWEEARGPLDILKAGGAGELKIALWRMEPWLIPGMPGHRGDEKQRVGRSRLFLPYHHDMKYWRYRVKPDFTSYVNKVEENKDDDGDVRPTLDIGDLCGFRIASISRVTITSATATMTGDDDAQPRTLFAVSVQTTRHGAALQRKVVEDEKLHNIDTWKKFGPVWNQSAFLRMVNILENAAHIGAREAANFVGLCFKSGGLVVNEGPDCYFTSPEQQCPYHNMTFPSGSRSDARRVIEAYQSTFGRNAALIPLVWGLGGHLKVLLGFWPHLQVQADKGAGKSTLIKRLERSIAFTMFSGQSLQTEFRLLTSISHTSHPVGWEELSARRQDVIDKAVALLQENYQYTVNRRGSDMTEFLLSAPVMLAGEDVPVRSLIGKLVRTELKVKGPLMADDLPRFPVRQWLEFLTGFSAGQVRELYGTFRQQCLEASRASGQDDGATRMAGNYAAILTAWRLLAEFAGVGINEGNVLADLKAQMNAHIAETSADREPWVWIMEVLLAELSTREFKAPHAWEFDPGEAEQGSSEPGFLLVRTSDVMHHLASKPALREVWNGLPVKSDRVFKKQATQAGVTVGEGCERTIHGRRVSHMTRFSLARLADYGLYATPVIEEVSP
jgi:hypothetical protein